ncbi:NACHT nucleoside triphosphatase [Aspergillus affinis]|uniref:NACHT nucleoside triphosphatase n=1 Tax=Aspergillus affinis TaxID=1070780 RepID=UPI0022FEA543|nr:NACHT nucleoside triphosphatase [Aspergillus affinis]KAI9044308.1 NACHT nucleoside triphosphatase [Aspergillus affinis]
MRGDVIRAYEKMIQDEGDNAVIQGARPLWNDAVQLLFDLIDEGTTTICIDAIDECDEDFLDELLELIHRLLTRADGGQVKILISSRPSLNVAGRLSSAPLLSVEVGHNSTDIEAYAREKAAKCVEKMGSSATISETENELTRHLVDGAQGMFLWVKLRALVLLRRSGRSIFKEEMFQPFRDLHKALVDLFEDIYITINNDPRESRAYQTALIIFRWLLCAQAPVRAEDLVRALALYMERGNIGSDANATEFSVPMVLESCQDLIVVDKDSNEFRFIHTAVRDFLEQKDGLQPQAQHAAVSDLCLATVQRSWLPQIQPASSLVLGWNDPHKDKIIQALSSPATSFFTACAFGFNNVIGHFIQLSKDYIDRTNNMGATGLHLASKYGHQEIAEALCRAGAHVDPIDNDSKTPLIRAAAGGYKALVLMLLKAGARVRAQGRRYGTALHGAALHGHLDVVGILLDHEADIKATGGQLGTALHAACLRGHVRVVKRLLDAGAEIEAPDRTRNEQETLEKPGNGTTTAASILSVVKNVLEQERNNRDVNLYILPQGFGMPLHTAARAGHEAVDKVLLSYPGISPNRIGGEYGIALQSAAVAGQTTIVRQLIDAKAYPDMQAGKYGTVLIAACRQASIGIVGLLLTSGASVNVQAAVYDTALPAACRSGNHLLVQRLPNSGADVKLTGGDYCTVLQAAAREGYEKIVQLLLQQGADVNVKGGSFRSALQAAAVGGHKRVVEMLLKAKRDVDDDVNHFSDVFSTPLQAALAGRHDSVARWLFEKGAKATKSRGRWGTSLQLSALSGNADLVSLCLKQGEGAETCKRTHGFDREAIQQLGFILPTCIGEYDPYPMVLAVTGGYTQIVTLLLEALPPKVSMSSDDNYNSDYKDSSDYTYHSDYYSSDLSSSHGQCGLYHALLLTLETNQEEVVSLLIDHVLPIDLETRACRKARLSVVVKLLELAENHTPEQDKHHKNLYALSKAIHWKRLELMELLLQRVIQRKNFVSSDLAEALHNTVSCESLEIVNKLLDCGANPTVESDSFKESQHVKPDFNGHTGADVNAIGGYYGTAVQAEAAGGHESIVQRLIYAGANLHYQADTKAKWLPWYRTSSSRSDRKCEVCGHIDRGWFGQTPLHRAAYYGNSAIVTLLLAKGANTEIIDREGCSPVLLTAPMGHREIFACLLASAAQSGTSSVTQEQQLLHSASRYGHIGIFEHLVAEQDIVDLLDDNDQTALSIAASSGHCSTVRFLIDKGSDINHHAHDRLTALHLAADSGYDDVVRLILK